MAHHILIAAIKLLIKTKVKNMKITTRLLKDLGDCTEGITWFENQQKTEVRDVVIALLADNHEDYAAWLLYKLMTPQNSVKYAIYCASQVLHICENKFPENKKPREAIEAAQNYLNDPTATNALAAQKAEAAAWAAAAAEAAAWAEAEAAEAAAAEAAAAEAAAASAAASAARAIGHPTYTAEYAVRALPEEARSEFRYRISTYALKLIEEQND